MFLGGILDSACLSVCTSIHVPICVQNTSFCQSAGRGIKSHLVTALVITSLIDVFSFSLQIKYYPREIKNLVRRKDTKRAEQRNAVKERKLQVDFKLFPSDSGFP